MKMEQRMFVFENVRTRQTAVLRQTPRRDTAVGKARAVIFDRAAELHAIARRNGRLHLKIDLQMPCLGGANELVQDVSLAAR